MTIPDNEEFKKAFSMGFALVLSVVVIETFYRGFLGIFRRESRVANKNLKMEVLIGTMGSMLLLLFSLYLLGDNDVVQKGYNFAIAYLVFRLFASYNVSPLDKYEYLRDKTSLGAGLAWNYWIALLERFHKQEPEPPFHSIKKVLFIPRSCSFKFDWNDERIQNRELEFEFSSPSIRVHHRESVCMKRPILEICKDENRKYLITYDFPRTLESSMGPSKDICDRYRQKQLKSFIKTTKKLLNLTASAVPVKLFVYDDRASKLDIIDQLIKFLEENDETTMLSSSGDEEVFV